MPTFFVDTDVFLRFLLDDHEEQAKTAQKYFEGAQNGEIELIVLPQVLLEVCYVLAKVYKVPKKQIVSKIKAILGSEYLSVIDRQNLYSAISLFENKNVDFVDAYIYSSAKNQKVGILTFDKDFDKF